MDGPCSRQVCLESADATSAEGAVASTHRGRTGAVGAHQPLHERTSRAGSARQSAAGGGRGPALHGCRACGGAAERRCGSPVGRALQSRGTGGAAARTRRRPGYGLWSTRAGTDPGRGAPDAGPRDGWDRHLVADHPATCVTTGAGWTAAGEHLYHLVCAARGRADVATGPQLVRDRRGGPPAQERHGDRARSRCRGKKKT
jgi:hypothetical protein